MKQINFRGDDDTLIRIVRRDNGWWSVLTAACDPRTGAKIQKFGVDPGNPREYSLKSILETLEEKYPSPPLVKVCGITYSPLTIANYLDGGRKYILKYKRVYEIKCGPKGFYTSELKEMRLGKDDDPWMVRGVHLFASDSLITELKQIEF